MSRAILGTRSIGFVSPPLDRMDTGSTLISLSQLKSPGTWQNIALRHITPLTFFYVEIIFNDYALRLRRIEKIINPLRPNDPYRGRTAPLTSKRCILYIYSPNMVTEYIKHGINCPYFSVENKVCFIILTYLVPVLFTFYIFIQQIWVLNTLNMV